MVCWVLSDGRLYTDDELVAEVARALGFQRLGSSIMGAIKAAIRLVRPR